MSSRTGSDAGRVAEAPCRSRAALVVPVVVGALTATLVAWSAWPAIRPARNVMVTQAVFDRSVDQPVDRSASEGQPPGGGKTVQAAGWLEAEPFSVTCAALADGVVESIDVLEGDRVVRGDVVARLVSEDAELRLAGAEAALAGARAELALREAELRAAQTDWEQPVELERAVGVARAAVAESRAELARLPSLIDAERAALVRLEEELARVVASEAQGVATDIELIVARQWVESQRAVVKSTEARDPLLAARVDRYQAELHGAERNLELRVNDRRRLDTTLAGVQRSQAAIQRAIVARDEAALELERMVIRAPIDGYVQRRYKSPGDKVVRMMDDPSSAQIARLYDPSRLQVRVDVPLADASHVVVGQRCEVVVEVLPDRTFLGEVLRVTHEADLQKNTLEVKVRVLDPSPILRPEMLTRVKFLSGRTPAGTTGPPSVGNAARTLVPSMALSAEGGSHRVWAVRERRGDRGVVRPVPVEVLSQSGGWARVRGAINPGDLLVAASDGLASGDRVRVAALAQGGGS